MLKIAKQAVGIGAGVLLYDLLFRGVHAIDWFRSLFVTLFAFAVLWCLRSRGRAD